MKTIAQILHKKKIPIRILDSKGNLVYLEDSAGCWSKRKYDSNGKIIYCENSVGYYWTIDENNCKHNPSE